MSSNLPTWWHKAQAQGIVPAAAQPPQTTPSPSWMVLVFSFFGAQLVLWPLLGTLGALFYSLLNSAVGSFVGSVLLAAGALGLAKSSRSLFVEQMALNLLLAAQMLWLWAFVQGSFQHHWGWIAASLLVFQLALAGLLPAGWLTHILAFQASWTFFFLPPVLQAIEPRFSFDSAMHWVLTWPRHTLWLAMLWAAWAHFEGRFLTKTWGAKLAQCLESAAVGLLLALMAALAGKYFVQSNFPVEPGLGLFPQSLLSQFVNTATVLQASAVVASALWLQKQWQPHGLLWLVYGAALVGCLWIPHIGAVTLVASFAAGTGRWRLVWLALAALLFALGSFYYDLQWTLVDKAAVLAGVGGAMALVLWWLRKPAGAVSALPRSSTAVWSTAVLAVAGGLALGVTQWDVQRKEAVLADGQKIFMRLQPQDPRSLMQGDYMALRFAYPAQVRAGLDARQAADPWLRRTLALAQLDPNGVAEIVHLAAPDEVPGAAQVLLPLQLLKGQWVVVTDAFFFPEGQGAPLAQAQFGEFRALGQGRVLLVGLADAQLQPIAPGVLADLSSDTSSLPPPPCVDCEND